MRLHEAAAEARRPETLSAGGSVGRDLRLCVRNLELRRREGLVRGPDGARVGGCEASEAVVAERDGVESLAANERQRIRRPRRRNDGAARVGEPGSVLFIAGGDIGGVGCRIEDEPGDARRGVHDFVCAHEAAGGVDHRKGAYGAGLDAARVFEFAQEDGKVADVLGLGSVRQEDRAEVGCDQRIEVIAQEPCAGVVRDDDGELPRRPDLGQRVQRAKAKRADGVSGIGDGQGDGVGRRGQSERERRRGIIGRSGGVERQDGSYAHQRSV